MTGDPYQNDQGYQTVSSLLLPRNATRVIKNAIKSEGPVLSTGYEVQADGDLAK